MWTTRRAVVLFLIVFTCLVAWLRIHDSPILTAGPDNKGKVAHRYRDDVELVVASLESDDVSWIQRYLPDWYTYRYVADNPRAPLTVPKNKGHEAMIYLTHIINYYSNLPPKVFMSGASFRSPESPALDVTEADMLIV